MKQQDLRELLKDEAHRPVQLPDDHRADFMDLLEQRHKTPSQKSNPWSAYAAVVVLLLGLTFAWVWNQPADTEVPVMALDHQMQRIEQEYLDAIAIEWDAFVKLTTDTELVERYKQRLAALDKSYQSIHKQFEQDKNNVLVLEALVTNLKERLQLLKDIQQHIHILNQNTNSHEHTL